MAKTGFSTYRLWAAVILVAVLALVPNLRLLWERASAYSGPKDAITMYEERFTGLKEALPADGVYGYITDADSQDMEYYLAQYSLAPRVITKDKKLPYVIGNFHSPLSLQDPSVFLPLVMVTDFGNGIVLFRNETSR